MTDIKKTKKAKVLVGAPTNDSFSFPFFQTYLRAITLGEEEGVVVLQPSCYRNICAARNEIAHIAIENDFTHVFYMDSDMGFPEFTLARLLAHDVDIVGGYYTRKTSGFLPNVFRAEDNGEWGTYIPDKGLEEIVALGTGCMLIKVEVFKKMSPPWFNYEPSPKADYHLKTEDVVFCENAVKAGFKIWCDGTVRCSHVAMVKITPVDGQQARVEALI